MTQPLILVLGGVRSGKSAYAASRAEQLAGEGAVRFIATARKEPSMQDRIERHRAGRPAGWVTVEEPLALAEAVSTPGDENVVLVDCLTLWLGNILLECGDPESAGFAQRAEAAVERRRAPLLKALDERERPVVLVANEVGLGVTPPTRLGNVFADVQGDTNRLVAALADEVQFLVAGNAIRVK
jgi:adenosylcobinamide kinase/adenosylcobinamide-phosphate guanylyltransferase